MTRFLLDTSALLTLRDDESGADQVANLLYEVMHKDPGFAKGYGK